MQIDWHMPNQTCRSAVLGPLQLQVSTYWLFRFKICPSPLCLSNSPCTISSSNCIIRRWTSVTIDENFQHFKFLFCDYFLCNWECICGVGKFQLSNLCLPGTLDSSANLISNWKSELESIQQKKESSSTHFFCIYKFIVELLTTPAYSTFLALKAKSQKVVS